MALSSAFWSTASCFGSLGLAASETPCLIGDYAPDLAGVPSAGVALAGVALATVALAGVALAGVVLAGVAFGGILRAGRNQRGLQEISNQRHIGSILGTGTALHGAASEPKPIPPLLLAVCLKLSR